MTAMQMLIQYALCFVGLPYRWGGDDSIYGFDCSGFVQELLMSVGEDPAGDQTAQGLYDYFKLKTDDTEIREGTLLFFGKSPTQITHIALAINKDQMIEAGGGGSATTSLEAAAKANAYIRIRPIYNRRDFVAALRPKYVMEKAQTLS